MAINKKLIFWKSSTFNPPTSSTDTTKDVLWNSIVFFDSTAGTYANSIWTHGKVFSAGTWGTNQTDYVPLAISGTTYNLSKNGHTHSYLPLSGGTLTGQINLTTTTITTPPANTIALAAKSDGLYQKIGTVETKLALTTDLTWANITSKPTTLSGYGIIDAYDKTTTDTKFEIRRPYNGVYNNLGNPTVREAALFHGQMNNKFRFIPAQTQEESTDGITWTASTRASSDQLADLMLGEGQSTAVNAIPAPAIGGTGYYRLTWDYTLSGVGYICLNELYIYNSTSGNNVNFKVEAYHNTNGWTEITNGNTNNWPGHTYIPHSAIWFSGTNAAQNSKVRITFSIISASYANPFTLYAIEWFGGYPAGRRNVESYDRYKNVTFPASVNATSFIGALLGNATTATTATKLSSNRTFALTGDVTGTITSDLTSGFSIATTIAPNSVALGTDTTGNYVASVGVSGNGLTITGTAGEGTTFTVNSNATNANTGSTLVFRDASGNFSAGTITATLSGNASSATTSKALIGDDTRSVNSAPSVYMSGGTRYVGYVGNQTEFKQISVIGAGTFLTGTYCFLETKNPWSDSNGGLPIQIAYGPGRPCWRIATDASTWGAWQALNAGGEASKLQTARTIWGQSFDGSANVSGNLDIGVSDLTFGGYSNGKATMNGLWGALNIYPQGNANAGEIYVNGHMVYHTNNLTNNLGANYLPKWNGSTLTNSIIYDNGNVGIGTISPQSALDIQRNYGNDVEIKLSQPGSSIWSIKNTASTGLFSIGSGGALHLNIDNSTGNVGVGVTDATAKLTVGGDISANQGIFGTYASIGLGVSYYLSARSHGLFSTYTNTPIAVCDPDTSTYYYAGLEVTISGLGQITASSYRTNTGTSDELLVADGTVVSKSELSTYAAETVTNPSGTLTLKLATETVITNTLTSSNSISISLPSPTSGRVNESILIFKIGASLPTITQPSGIVYRISSPTLVINSTWTFVYEQVWNGSTWEIYCSTAKNV